MKRGEIYAVDLGPGVGREVSGVQPVVVISADDDSPVFVVVIPAVDSSEVTGRGGVLVTAKQSGHAIDLIVRSTQPRTLDPSRFPEHPSGTVPPESMRKIGFALKVFLDIE